MEDESYWLKSDLDQAEADLDRLREMLASANERIHHKDVLIEQLKLERTAIERKLQGELAASLKLQQDLAEENVQTRARLKDAERVIDEVVPYLKPGIDGLAGFSAIQSYRAKYPEGKRCLYMI